MGIHESPTLNPSTVFDGPPPFYKRGIKLLNLITEKLKNNYIIADLIDKNKCKSYPYYR